MGLADKLQFETALAGVAGAERPLRDILTEAFGLPPSIVVPPLLAPPRRAPFIGPWARPNFRPPWVFVTRTFRR